MLTTLTTLPELAAIGVDQETRDLIGNVNGDFVGDIGPNNPSSPDVSFTDLVLNEPTLRNTVDAIAASEAVPAGATVLTTAQQALTQITAGTVGNPNIFLIQGDITLAPNETIVVPSNVEIYVDGSIFKAGQFTAAGALGNDFENNVDSIFDINGSDNIRLVGINNALLHSTPSFQSTQPHTSGVIITGTADNITFEGFETRFLWGGVNARFGATNIAVRDNLFVDTINRAVWYLGVSNSTVTNNFVTNAGGDGIDFDAFAAENVAYENVVVGAGRFSFFVEEGANNNFSVRQLTIMNQFAQASRQGFQLGNGANGTGPFFSGNNPGDFTRDNFFIDNVTYAPSTQPFRGDFIATGDNNIVGNSYFFGNRGFGAGPGAENNPNRNVSVRALYEDRLPAGEILAARDQFFDSERGFIAYDLVDVLNGFIDEFDDGATPIRPEILPEPAVPRVVYQESGGQVVLEAENYTSQTAGTGSADGQFFGLLIDDDRGGLETFPGDSAVGAQGVVVERNLGTNTGTALNGPRLDYEIDFLTPGTYNVHVRTRASNLTDPTVAASTNNSVHVGLNGTAVTTGGGQGLGTDSSTWVFVNDVSGAGGAQNITVTVTTPGRHTLNLWAREDGTEVDRIVLTTSAAAPTGFGPAESATLIASPLAGDYDLDLDVDQDDYQVWLANAGSNASPWADGNGDGIVNTADYAVWRDNLGASAPAVVASSIEASPAPLAVAEVEEIVEEAVALIAESPAPIILPPLAAIETSQPGSAPEAPLQAAATTSDATVLLLAQDAARSLEEGEAADGEGAPGQDAASGAEDPLDDAFAELDSLLS